MADVGNTIHALFAAGPLDAFTAERTAIAQPILVARGLTGLTTAEELVAAHDRLRAFAARTLPSGTWRREAPVVGALAIAAGRRHVRGSIDLLVDAPTQYLARRCRGALGSVHRVAQVELTLPVSVLDGAAAPIVRCGPVG